MDNTGPPSGTWAWAIQREIDNLQRTNEARYAELATRIDRVVSATEYGADKRAADQQHRALLERLSGVEKDIEILKKELIDRIDSLRKDHDSDVDKVVLLLDTEKNTREEEENKRRDKHRWLIAAVMIPIVLVIAQIIVTLKT
ncbi:hypothetical protein HWB05_gp163 [Streptomyces phage BRock]|uniref:Uncharacterized protein n=1 Tax=Streptomyces phage BRock TaxID=1913591 RepID=A0A1J0GW63_9CAUD|nr:hypothetical protein HWB05_gp163 [Streptomyces phage BRock]APC46426.2 hypothetical protein [Streptomyces phage BRock]